MKMVRDGSLKPVIDLVPPLKECLVGIEALANRNVFGKVVLVP